MSESGKRLLAAAAEMRKTVRATPMSESDLAERERAAVADIAEIIRLAVEGEQERCAKIAEAVGRAALHPDASAIAGAVIGTATTIAAAIRRPVALP